ncbi:MAG: phosphoenolpyruvate--protein phosphotransferase [Oscillospiraceae bacterium]|jgi:phosphotransferase system enzyme I (PtsI)|nr:phosphoenolpyruvate--protein phosphotransferase [Oscillospiraceae bacterium]
MQIKYGKPVMEGISIGKIFVYNRMNNDVCDERIVDVETEIARYKEARTEVIVNLQELYEKSIHTVGKATASIFLIQQMVAQDDNYNTAIESMIRSQKVNAQYAVAKVADSMALIFKMMDNTYMRERAADISDVSEKIINALNGGIVNVIHSDEPVVLITDDLSPTETYKLTREKVLSIVTINGSVNSHTAIIAKTMGLPALIKTDIELNENLTGKLAIVDCYHNCVYIDPSEEVLEVAQNRLQRDLKQKEIYKELRGKKTVSPQGKTINLLANINSLNDVDIALSNDAEGIGLFRTEFFFLAKERFPTENEQFEIYKKVLMKMGDKPVTIRTFDLGADKATEYLRMPEEKNPALGLRGIRFGLNRSNILITQLKALLRASLYGNLKILLPLIISVEEVEKVYKILNDIEDNFHSKGIEIGDYKVGVMIETPAAVMISDLLAARVDFFSVGTNDLTQYTLAIDRQNQFVEPYYNAKHTAIKRMLDMVAVSAKANAIELSICGELAANLTLTDYFLSRGYNSLSVVPEMIFPLKQKIMIP